MSTVTSGTGLCSATSGVADDGNGGQLVLSDTTTDAPNTSGILVKKSFSSTSALYAQFDTQSYGNGGGARTLWLINATAPTPTLPSGSSAGGYGSASGGIPGGVLGITLDASGQTALTNNPACPNVGWDANKSTANQVVVKARDTSASLGTSGYCFVASTSQPIGTLTDKTGTLGALHQSSASNGWQRVFVSILPPSFTNDLAELTVAVDAANGKGLVTVLDIALPTWVWQTTPGNMISSLRLGLSASNPTDPTANDVVAVRDFRAVAVAPSPAVPSSPLGVGVQWSAPNGGQVSGTVSWSAPQSDGYTPITGYTALLNGSTCSPATLTGTTFSCTISQIPAGDTYTISVVATNAVGDSVPGVAISSVAAQPQTIALNPLPTVNFGAGPARVVATATSGLPVSVNASGACSYINTQLIFTAAGLCTVTAAQPGTLSYAAANSVVRTVQVGAAPVTIKVSSVSAVVDGAGHPVTPTVTPSNVPLTITYCSVVNTTQCSTTAPSAVGSYRATVQPASSNYTATPVTAVVDILPVLINLPPDAGGPKTGTNGKVQTTLQPSSDPTVSPQVQTSGAGFTPGAPVAIAVTGQESLGTFTIPSSNPADALPGLLQPSTSATSVQSAVIVTATSPTDLTNDNSIAFPFGNFPGPGEYVSVTFTSSGFVPNSTVSSLLHSSPIVLSTAVADANGNVTITAPIPTAFAGQTHKIVLTGTYLSSTTTAGPDGKVSATTAIPQDLFSRLENQSQLVITAVDQNDPTNFSKSYLTIGDPAVTTTTLAGSANDVLQAPPLVPTDHPAATMKQVTNLVAVAATVAATAATAASVAGSVGSIRVPGGGGGAPSAPRPASGGSSGSSGSSGPLSTQQIGVATDELVSAQEKFGDRSRLWRAPGRAFIDRISVSGPSATAHVSPMFASALADGAYLRAMFGSLSLAMPFLGALFAVFNVVNTHGYPVPGSFGIFAVMMVLGALDGWSGLASSLVVLIGAIVTGHLFSLNMAVSYSLVAALLFGTAIIVKGIRPLVRDSHASFQDRWNRAGDLIVGPLFGGFLATQLVNASASAAGLALPITQHASQVGLAVGVALFIRYALSSLATLHFPGRLAALTVPELTDQKDWAQVASQVIRLVFTGLLLHAFLGWSWVLGLLIGIQALQAVVQPRISGRLPNVLYRLVPRGVVNVLAMATIGTVGGRIMSHYISNGFWQVAGLLILLATVNLVYAIATSFDGEEIPVNWYSRIAGVGVCVITALQLTGRLI